MTTRTFEKIEDIFQCKLVLENGNFSIVLLEDYPCERKEQLLARERYFIETLDCVNKWYQDTKKPQKVNEHHIEWVNRNREKLADYQKRYKNKNKNVVTLNDESCIILDDELITENEPIELKMEELYDFKL
jgi:hypothetical protein